MKKILNLIFLLICLSVFSQKITVKDSLDNQVIPYAEIVSAGNTFFADSLGSIEVKQTDFPILIKRIGYEEKKIQNYQETIYMTPKINKIEEVVLRKKTDVNYESKILNNNTTKLPNDLTIGFIIAKNNNTIGQLKEISIPLKRIYNNHTLLKLDFYEISNGIVSKEALNNESIIINVADLTNRKNNKFNLLKYKIFFGKSMLISLRIIDETGKTERKLGNPSIQFYNSKEKGDLLFYNQYLKDWKLLAKNINLISLSYVVAY